MQFINEGFYGAIFVPKVLSKKKKLQANDFFEN